MLSAVLHFFGLVRITRKSPYLLILKITIIQHP